jgi:hypothetical protein
VYHTVCNADLDFKSSESEDTTLVESFLKMTVPSRKVLKFQTSHPGPPHLKRTASILFTGSKGGKDNWITELKLAAEEWHTARDSPAPKRIAVEVGTISQRMARTKSSYPTPTRSGKTWEQSSALPHFPSESIRRAPRLVESFCGHLTWVAFRSRRCRRS